MSMAKTRFRTPSAYMMEATYTNRAHISGKMFRTSNTWHIEGNKLVSRVGEEITFQPVKKTHILTNTCCLDCGVKTCPTSWNCRDNTVPKWCEEAGGEAMCFGDCEHFKRKDSDHEERVDA